MVTDLKETASKNYTQKIFLKHSLFNAVILFKLVAKDFFKYFIFKIKPFSRYEFWCYFAANLTALFFTGSVLILISFAVPVISSAAEFMFYVCVVITALMSLRVFAGRLINAKEYVSYVDLIPNKYKIFDKLEKAFLDFFFSISLFYTAGFLKIIILSVYLFGNFFYGFGNIELVDRLYEIKLIDFIVFVLKAMGTVYFVFSVAPSVHRLDYLEKSGVEYYPVAKYSTWYSKEYIIDYLSLLACFFVIISIGYIFIVGYSVSLHIVICAAILIQGTALMLSGRFLSAFMGLSSILFIIYTNIVFAFLGFEQLFISNDAVYFTINYYQVSVAMLFVGMLYFTTFDRDIIKILSIISFFLSALFMLEDSVAFKGMIVYDFHSLNIAFYAFIELISIFIFLSRVAYNKGSYQSDARYAAMLWNDFREIVNFIKLKHIYMILYYASIVMVIYSVFMWLIPFVFNITAGEQIDADIMTTFFQFRHIIAFYVFLGLFLLFKNYNDVFPMFIISSVILGEVYVLLFTSINMLITDLRVYPVEYIYVFLYSVMVVIAICVNRYNHYIAAGFGLSIILVLITVIDILFHKGFRDNIFIYNLFFFTLIISNLLVVIGSYNKIKEEKRLELEEYAGQ